MSRPCSHALCAALLLPAALVAADDGYTEGEWVVGGGFADVDGDRPAFQQAVQQRRGAFGGIEEYRLYRETDDTIFRFDTRIVGGEDDYRLAARWEKPEAWYIDAGLEQFRVWYDGSAGFFRPTGTVFHLFDEDLSLTRSKAWIELGRFTPNQTLLSFRYEWSARDGTKNSTSWGDTNLVGAPYGTRSIVPAFWDIDEVTHLFRVDARNDAQEGVKWGVGARYSETTLDNQRHLHRRPGEAAERIVTSKDGTKSDLFAAHGFYQRQVNEKLTLSGGALIADLDAQLSGSRIYGAGYDPIYDPAFVRRQQRDEGFFDLGGHAELKQTVLNLNAVYLPRKHWSIRPSLRFENLHQETLSEFIETNVGGGPTLPAIIEEVEAGHEKRWDEFAEAIEIRYTGKPNWTFSTEAEWVQGEGNLEEERIIHHTTVSVDRDTDYQRTSQKYSAKANWYAKPGLTFAGQYYYKVNINDYDAVRDNTPVVGGDRYPAYITDQDFETHDLNFRISWRPLPLLSLVTRYDYQRSRIISTEAGLSEVESSVLTSHILSQNITWTPTNRLYASASVNVTWDQLETPAYLFVQNGDNNYINGSLGVGYALAEKDDVFLDYAFYNADNFSDNSQLSLPFNADQEQHTVFVTWTRRQSENLVYTLKYGYITNQDGTWAGLNDFDANVLYGKVQYRF